jgi:class 3 adenylate cyclase
MKSSKTNVRGASRKAMEKKEPTQFGDHLDFKQMKFLRRKINKLKKLIDSMLESGVFIISMSIVTVYALFADDIRQLITDFRVDDGFYIMTSVCLGLFSLEIILSSFAKPKYFLRFFFWLDLLSTLSLLLDIGWVSNAIFDTGTGSSGTTATAAQLARAGRASRVGARAARIVKIVRLIRLVRIVKLYKAAQATLALENPHQVMMTSNFPTEQDESIAAHNPPSSAVLQSKVTLSREILSQMEQTDGAFGTTSPPLNALSPERESLNRKSSQFVISEEGNQRRMSYLNGVTLTNGVRRPSRFAEEGPLMIRRLSIAAPLENNPQDSSPKRSGSPTNKPHPVAIPETTPRNAQSLIRKTMNKQKRRGSKYRASIEASSHSNNEERKKKHEEIPRETNVGKKLSNLTTKRVITVVMSVLITIPLFSTDTYLQDYSNGESGLRSIWLLNSTDKARAFDLCVRQYIGDNTRIRSPLFVLDILGDKYFENGNENNYRDTEKQYYYIQGDNSTDVKGYACFDIRPDNQLGAILSISRTIFVTIVLALAAMSFSKDTNELVLFPIENMLIKVKRIAANPLAAAQIEEEDALMFDELEKQGKYKALLKKKKETNYETNILEKTILKLGALLALGFGEAGSNIIAQNMSKGGEVDPMIPGKKVMAIFGFCDIRNFTDATEVLQEGVMVFVNEIAEIVHGTINEFSGAANKNIGDAFLLVWKIPDEEVEEDSDTSDLKLKTGSIKVSQLADMSVVSFLKVFSGIHRSKKLEKYRHNEGLNERLPNYSVKMGFGLHIGWAIEGSIGSEYKIDASYLSPNVNMAARLEAATKQFGVPLLISGSLYDVCTSETKKMLRRIDRVTVKGSNQPIDLYTCDLDHSRLTIDRNEVDFSTLTAVEKKKQRVQSRTRRDDLREKAFTEQTRVSKFFVSDKDIILMRSPFTREFYVTFKEGMNAYTYGDWEKARHLFETTQTMLPDLRDGPSSTILNVMKENDYKAPPEWRGYRELTEK